MADARKPGWLTKLEVDEVSLVPKGAAQNSRLLFRKADDQASQPAPVLARAWASLAKVFASTTGNDAAAPRSVAEIMGEQDFWEDWVELRDALEQSVCEIMVSNAANKPDLLKQTVTQFLQALEATVGTGAADVAKIDAAVAAALEALPRMATVTDVKDTLNALDQTAGKPIGGQPCAVPVLEKAMAKTAQELLDAMSEEDRATLVAHFNAGKPAHAEPDGDEGEEAVAKSLPEAVRKMLDAAKQERVALQKALETEREIRVTKEIADEVRGYALPGMESAKAVSVIKAAQQGKPVDVADLRAMFTATTEIVKAHNTFLQQMGSPVGMDAAEHPVTSEVTRLAKAWLDQHPTTGSTEARMAVAKAAVYEARPDLLAAEMTER